MKRSYFLVSFVFSSFVLMAQGLPSFEGNKSTSSAFLQKVVPPSPTAASLGKYGDQQINMFTGTSAVNIPIYEIKTNGFSVPLSLAYSSSGLRVTEAASPTGLGWSLAGTGVVTRVVKDVPDVILNPLNIRIWPLPNSYTKVSDNAWNYIHSALQIGLLDSEPDIFIVKAGKLSVKFYYDLHKRIQTIPYNNDIKIKFDGVLDQYTITDNDGTQYFFGGSQATEVTMSTNPTYANYTTSWFLTKIITPVGAQILYNNSKGTNTILQDQYSESEEVKPGGQVGDCSANGPSGRNTQWTYQSFYPVFLNSIETDQEIVYLVRDVNQRADMPGDYALTDIKVYSKSSGKYEFNYSLVYSYFPQVSTICWGNGTFPNHPHNLTAICKQLRLDQFIEKGYEGNTAGFKTYQFQYSTKPVPSRCSLDQDFWGYYNGAGNTSLLPSVAPDPDFQGSTFNAVSREANPNYGDAGMLQKIIYPTGGETDFVYEPNEVNSVSTGPTFQTVNTTLSGNSPSLESSVTFTITSTQPVTLSFTLSDANLPDQGLQRKAEIIDPGGIVKYVGINTDVNAIIVTGNGTPAGGLAPGIYTLKVSRNYLYSTYPSVPPVSLIASVTYAPSGSTTVVSRKIGGFRIRKVLDKTDPTGSDINVKEFFYDNTYFVADIKNSDCISNYHRWFIYYVADPGGGPPNANHTYECYFRSRTTSSVQPIGSVQGSHIAYGKVTCSYGINGSNGKTEFFYSTDHDQGGFSLTPFYRPITSYDHRRGNLLSQVDYDASGSIKRIKANNYEYILKNTGLFTSAYYTRDEPSIALHDASWLPQKVIGFKDFALPGEWVRIKNTSETVFDGPTNISTIKEFSYDNTNYAYVTQTKTTNSKGNILTEINQYPLDAKPVSTKSNEEIERQFETDYQTLFNNFYTCDGAAANSTAVDACYTTYQTAYDNLLNNRVAALANYESTFTTLANGTADPVLKGKYQLIAKNKVAELTESRVTKDVSTELSKKTNDFKDFSGNILLEKVNSSLLGNTLENEVTVNSYDLYGNILQATPKDGIIKSFIWDYQYKFPVAEVSNATTANIAYTSFEADGKGNWTFTGTPVQNGTAPTGRKVYNLSAGAITKAVTSTITYFISYWRPVSLSALTITGTQAGYPITGRTVNGWKYIEHKVSGISSASLSGTGSIDELRLYPTTALMSTSTYEPLKGLTSRCDASNRIAYYDYDVFGRLVLIRDQDRNILKKICYNYAGQPEDCNIYVNTPQQGTFYKQGCTGCQVGSAVTYTVAAGLYSSTISPFDADAKALAEVNANGQTYANANGTCIVAPVVPVLGSNAISAKSFSLQFHNNCTSANYNFTLNPSVNNVSLTGIPQGNYTVTISAVGGGSTQYTYRVNEFTQHTISANITVDLSPVGNTLTITP